MKRNIRLLALLCALIAVLAFASCGGDESASDSQSESQSESVDDGTYTVKFYYGVKTYDAATKTVTEYANVKEVRTTGEGVEAPKSADLASRGYKFTGWDSTEWNGKAGPITKNLEIHQKYIALAAYTITFKNAIGNVITEFTMYDGEKLSEEQIPSTDGYLVYTAEQYAAFSDDTKADFVAVPGATGYYMNKADEAKATTAIAVPYGCYYKDWASSGKDFSASIKEDRTYTVNTPAADAVIPLVAKEAVTVDGVIDKSLYAKIATNLLHPISFGKGEGSASSTTQKGISDVLNAYATKAEAEAAGKGDEWQKQKDNFERVEKLSATLYACWDGDYIYYCVEVNDPSVNTNGATYAGVRNPYETDSVEIWYQLEDEYFELFLDAAGFTAKSHPDRKQYISYITGNELFASKVYEDLTDLETPVTVDLTDTAPRALASGEKAGYVVEIANPAFGITETNINEEHPLDPTFGGSNWGTALVTGTVLPMSFQINSISAPATEEVVSAVIEIQNTKDDFVYSIAEYLNRTGATEGEKDLYNNMKRWNAGWQLAFEEVHTANPDANLIVVLG